MAKAKAKKAVHPKPMDGDEGRGHSYVDPSRGDQIAAGEDDSPGEVISLFKKEEVDVGHGGDDSAQDDARQMASEGEDDGEEATTVQRGGLKKTKREADGDDRASYSKKVRARINREIALRRERETQLQEERAARQKQDERLAKLERNQAEISGNSGVKELEAKIATLKTQLAQATESGETKDVMELQIALTDALSDLKLKKYSIEQDRKQREKDEAAAATQAKETGTERPVGKDRTEEFIAQNRHWWGRRQFAAARAEAIEIDKDLLGEIKSGESDFEPYSDEHFEELAQRLASKFPDVEISSPDGEPYEFESDEDEEPPVNDRNRQRPAARAPMGGLGGRNGRRENTPVTLAKQGKVVLTERDFAEMRMFGLNPNSTDDKKAFGKERVRTLLADERKGAAR